MGGFNLKICHNFVGTIFFVKFVEGYSQIPQKEFIAFCPYPQTYQKSLLGKLHIFVFNMMGTMEKVFCWLHISNYNFNNYDQNPSKMWRSSVFREKLLETFSMSIYLGF